VDLQDAIGMSLLVALQEAIDIAFHMPAGIDALERFAGKVADFIGQSR
jgi:hypothetical protein